MILPIVAFGHEALRVENDDLTPEHPDLETIIENMYETMYNAKGVGLAGPQVNLSYRIFIVDGSPMGGEGPIPEEDLSDFKKVFINPEILEEEGEEWAFEEGCLSIPDIREDVMRKSRIKIRYQDENFEEKTEEFEGMKARIIQHEYDHLEGVLFTDHLSGLRKRLLKKRLSNISKGKIDLLYPMKFPKSK